MEPQIGQRICKFRQNKNVSLEELAQRTGLDLEFLTAVEQEGLYPSLGPLLKIARALGLRLGTFLDDAVSQDPFIVRQQERPEQFTTHRGRGAEAEVRFFSLGRGKRDRSMEPFFVELLPESAKVKGLSSHEGEECVMVLSGKAKLVYAQQVYELNPGDSVYYNSIVPHHLGCSGEEKAEIFAVLYFPE